MLWQTLLLLLLSLFLSPSFVFPSVIFLVDCVQMSQQQQQQQQENIYDLFYLFITGFSLCVCSLSPSHHSLFSLFYEEKSGVSVRVCVYAQFLFPLCAKMKHLYYLRMIISAKWHPFKSVQQKIQGKCEREREKMPPSFGYIRIQNQACHLANVVNNKFGFKGMLLQIFTHNSWTFDLLHSCYY